MSWCHGGLSRTISVVPVPPLYRHVTNVYPSCKCPKVLHAFIGCKANLLGFWELLREVFMLNIFMLRH